MLTRMQVERIPCDGVLSACRRTLSSVTFSPVLASRHSPPGGTTERIVVALHFSKPVRRLRQKYTKYNLWPYVLLRLCVHTQLALLQLLRRLQGRNHHRLRTQPHTCLSARPTLANASATISGASDIHETMKLTLPPAMLQTSRHGDPVQYRNRAVLLWKSTTTYRKSLVGCRQRLKYCRRAEIGLGS